MATVLSKVLLVDVGFGRCGRNMKFGKLLPARSKRVQRLHVLAQTGRASLSVLAQSVEELDLTNAPDFREQFMGPADVDPDYKAAGWSFGCRAFNNVSLKVALIEIQLRHLAGILLPLCDDCLPMKFSVLEGIAKIRMDLTRLWNRHLRRR